VKLFPKLEPSLASPKIEGMTSPVQSGSDRILKLMRRWHSAEDYKRCILRVRELNPGLMLRTGVIAGFPSETEEDHARSVELMDTLAYDYAAVFGFSERPGTDIPPELERVPHEVINRRRLELDEVVKTRSRRWTEASPRRTHPFLAAAEARP
jgi:tRNA-2-methylthio-N6-dimethylallyladenosine synthase